MKKGNKKNVIGEIWVIIAIIVSIVIGWIYSKFKQKTTKSKAATSYGISRKVLRKWIELFCSEEVKEKYKGKKKLVSMGDLYKDLGIPYFTPKYRGKRIIKKEDLRRAFDLSHTSFSELIKKVPNPEQTIGMSLEIYLNSLESFPPKKIALICSYIEKSGHKKKTW